MPDSAERTHKPETRRTSPVSSPITDAPAMETLDYDQVTPETVLSLQRQIGNAAVQRWIMRQSAPGLLTVQPPHVRAVTTTCITREFARRLTDPQLQECVAALQQEMLVRPPTDPLHLAAAENLQIIRQEVDHRARNGRMTELLANVTAATDTAAHRAATDALIDYVRAQLNTYPPLVNTFIQQANPGMDEKTRILGRVTAAFARTEFLLGNIYHQGARNWEVNAAGASTSNRGHMVDAYTGGSAMEWCSRFATTALSRLRGDNGVLAASGYRIANPVAMNNELNYDTAYGGDFAGITGGTTAPATSPFAALRTRLQRIANGQVTDQTAQQAVDDFFTNHIRPQAGDIMIVRRGSSNANAFSGSSQSHTTMVERLDGYRISTIEGNTAGGRVAGHVFDLTQVADVEEIVFISRPSLASGMTTDAERATIGAGTPAGTPAVTEDQLMEPVEQMNTMLQQFAAQAGHLRQPAAGETDSVANLTPP